ncbi:MAG: hypothetical protein AAFX06_19800 [Planctomycetota bacterium]
MSVTKSSRRYAESVETQPVLLSRGPKMLNTTRVALLATFIFTSTSLRAERDTPDAKQAEEKLERLLSDAASAPVASKADLHAEIDRRFAEWITNTAPASRHSVGWSEGQRAQTVFTNHLKAEKEIHTRIIELRRVLKHEVSEFQTQSVKQFCNTIADQLRNRAFGISLSHERRLDDSLKHVESDWHLAGYSAMLHLAVAQQQLLTTPDSTETRKKLAVAFDELERLLVRAGGSRDTISLQEWLESVSRRYQVRTVNREQERDRRSESQSLLLKHPRLRRYLVARQARQIIDRRWELARLNLPRKELGELQTRRRLAEALEKAFLDRCGSRYDSGLQQLIQAVETQQTEIRHLQESRDIGSFTVATYNVERRLVTTAHLKHASECAFAMGQDELAQRLQSLAGQQ